MSVNVGDFISYKDHMMAVIDMDEKHAYVLCNDNHKCKRIDVKTLEGNDINVVKKNACNSIIRAFFDDMSNIRR